nr:uncharacterized protein LOC104115369 [Nicotiana tomentosiformis]
MTGISLEVAVHKLSLDPNFPPVRQKKRPIAEVRNSPGMIPLAAKEAVLVPGTVSGVWTLFTDGASNIEIGAYKNIGEQKVIDFIWDHIICRFGIPKEIACDNGPQFIGSKVTKFLKGLKIKRITSSLYHPSANGHVESTNKIIIQNLKKKLEDAKGNCPDELPGVLWAYRTTSKSSTGETQFSLVYVVKDLIPFDIGEPNIRYSRANEEANNEVLLSKLDFLEEHRNLAYVRMVAQNQRMKRYYNRRANL